MTLAINIPTSWAELSDKQLLVASKILGFNRAEEHLQLLAAKTFANLRFICQVKPGVHLCIHKRKRYLLDADQLNTLRKQMSWITATPFGVKPLSQLGGQKPVYETLEGVPLRLYLAADNYYQAFLYTKESRYLHNLAACLYGYDDNWNDSQTAARAKAFGKLKAHKVFTAFLWFASVKHLFAAQFPHLFSPSGSSSGDNTPPDMRASINGIIRALTGGDVTKTSDVLDAELWTAFSELDSKALEIENLKKHSRGKV